MEIIVTISPVALLRLRQTSQRGATWGRGPPDLENTNIYCRLFWSGFLSSDRRQYFGVDSFLLTESSTLEWIPFF